METIMETLEIKKQRDLPEFNLSNVSTLDEVTAALGLPRNILPSGDEIKCAWENLPIELEDIPPFLLNELIAKMCVAVSTGLFDGAINYIWNASILHLREKVIDLGIKISAIIHIADFEEKNLHRLQDSAFLELCLKLNIIDQNAFFFLDKSRAMRNSHSAAHPVMGTINNKEFISFLKRCVKYALSGSGHIEGVNVLEFDISITSNIFTEEQCSFWIKKITETNDSHRRLLISHVHYIYCDPHRTNASHINAFSICKGLKNKFNSNIYMDLISQHYQYVENKNDFSSKASLQFFEELGLISLLDNLEGHNIFFKAVERLWRVHNGSDNFYNELPFAEHLLEILEHSPVPESVREHYVQTVVCCFIGDEYGHSMAAEPIYEKIIRNFGRDEVGLMMKLASKEGSILKNRLVDYSCRERFKEILLLVDIGDPMSKKMSGKF